MKRYLGIRFELINNNDELIFLDKNNDPFTGNPNDGDYTDTLINQGSFEIINIIGSNNFDIGHVFSGHFAVIPIMK